MATTLKANIIIPEVLADYVESKLTDNSVFAPLATIDDTLVGQGGDTIKFPKYAYIGKADVTDENGQIIPVALSATSTSKTVHKLTKAVQITDEARLSAYGNPMDEAGGQIAKAIDDKTDDEFLTELKTCAKKIGFTADLASDQIVDALEEFGEDQDGIKALVISPKDLAALRKDDDYINKSEIATGILIRGAVGMIWGCQIIPSNRLKEGTTDTQRNAFIIKPGALSLIMKRGVLVETKREPDYSRDTVYATKHAVPYLKDESKVVQIIRFKSIAAPGTGVVVSVEGKVANGTIIAISEAAPTNFKWVYKLGTTDVTPTFGTALSGYTDWVSSTTEIDAGATNTKASVALVDAANKPVKHINLTLDKNAGA